MSVDWKPRLLEAAAKATGPRDASLKAAVNEAIGLGAATAELSALAQQTPALLALFQDGFDPEKRPSLAPLTPAVTAGAPAGLKPHALRAAGGASLPWFKQATLPSIPKSTLSATTGATAGALSASDVEQLLRLAA